LTHKPKEAHHDPETGNTREPIGRELPGALEPPIARLNFARHTFYNGRCSLNKRLRKAALAPALTPSLHELNHVVNHLELSKEERNEGKPERLVLLFFEAKPTRP
jgi:hypothetical protein